jgi:hypothetical protein
MIDGRPEASKTRGQRGVQRGCAVRVRNALAEALDQRGGLTFVLVGVVLGSYRLGVSEPLRELRPLGVVLLNCFENK